MATTVTIETCYSSVSIEVEKDDLDIIELIDDLLKPALRATGYTQETIEKYMHGTEGS